MCDSIVGICCAHIIGIWEAHMVRIRWWAHFFVVAAVVSYVAYWRLLEREMSSRNELANELDRARHESQS